MKLNLGSGLSKFKGYVNIDSDRNCKPDFVLDFVKKDFPYTDGSVEEILFFHCIEHIQKRFHRKILLECSRVLKVDGMLLISYPDFWECAQRWRKNMLGMKDFWEATLYGRQTSPQDFHVCAMDSDELKMLLIECGFESISTTPESKEPYNRITKAVKKSKPAVTYEELLAIDIRNMEVHIVNYSKT